MPRTVTRDTRASETVTIRLTREQKRLLERIASAAGTTATGVVRECIRARSVELGLVEPACGGAGGDSPAAEPSRPGGGAPAPATPAASTSAAPHRATFGDLAQSFRASFGDRGEGTRRELDEAIAFLLEPAPGSGAAPLPSALPLAELTPSRLAALRESLRTSGLRLSRKNLYLTYLRMMLQFALKRDAIPADVNPGDDLRAFSALEAGESWVPPPPGAPR
jgi:hypothetical protein